MPNVTRRLAAILAVTFLSACVVSHQQPGPADVSMVIPDPLEFDFTETEVFFALRLVTDDHEARRQAVAFAQAYRPGMNWAIDNDGLLQLLALGSESGAARVERLRKGLQARRYDHWAADERRADPSVSEAELARRWADVTAAEDRDWAVRLDARRREPRGHGTRPP